MPTLIWDVEITNMITILFFLFARTPILYKVYIYYKLSCRAKRSIIV
jgi:hypothetical protein